MAAAAPKPRMAYIDNIRWTVIAMVVLVHACVTYSGLGSWYYKEPACAGHRRQARVLDVLHLLPGVLHGPALLRGRGFHPGLVRQEGLLEVPRGEGVPPGDPGPVLHADPGPGHQRWPRDLGTGHFVSLAGGSAALPRVCRQRLASSDRQGPLWFAVALLAFSAVYAVVRLVGGLAGGMAVPAGQAAPESRSPRGQSHGHCRGGHGDDRRRIIFRAAWCSPIGTSWHNMQLCFFPEYVVLFVVGLWAGRRGFLRALPRQAGMLWLKLAFIIGVPAWFLLLGLGGALTGSEQAFVGGMHWQAAGYAAWEAFFAVSVSIGLLTLYREKANVRNRATGLLADTCFGIYVFHAPILVAVSMVLRAFTVYPLAKAAIAAVIAFAVSLDLRGWSGRFRGFERCSRRLADQGILEARRGPPISARTEPREPIELTCPGSSGDDGPHTWRPRCDCSPLSFQGSSARGLPQCED